MAVGKNKGIEVKLSKSLRKITLINVRTVSHWNALANTIVCAGSINSYKNHLVNHSSQHQTLPTIV